MNDLTPIDAIDPLFQQVKEILEGARAKAYSAVNFAMVDAYWHIGKAIVDRQGGDSKAEYGEGLLKELSEQLTAEFGKDFDQSNLRNIRKFFLNRVGGLSFNRQ